MGHEIVFEVLGGLEHALPNFGLFRFSFEKLKNWVDFIFAIICFLKECCVTRN